MSKDASATNLLGRVRIKAGSESDRDGRALVRRAALVIAMGMTAAAAAAITAPGSAAAQMDPALVRLLRAMVGIKGIIALAGALELRNTWMLRIGTRRLNVKPRRRPGRSRSTERW